MPVQADVPDIEVILLDERDERINPLGIKGAGEIGITGVAAAIANAAYNASGIRVRDLPITPDKLIGGLAPLGSPHAEAPARTPNTLIGAPSPGQPRRGNKA